MAAADDWDLHYTKIVRADRAKHHAATSGYRIGVPSDNLQTGAACLSAGTHRKPVDQRRRLDFGQFLQFLDQLLPVGRHLWGNQIETRLGKRTEIKVPA